MDAANNTELVQRQTRALANATRHEIFQLALTGEAPVGVAELAERFGVHANAIRQHLGILVDAALLVERTAPASGRGRPRHEYTVDPAAQARWGPTSPYEALAVWLSDLLRTGDSPETVGERAGSLAVTSASTQPVDAVEELVDQMARHGFAPEVTRHGDTVDIELRACPFPSVASTDPATVCGLHLGLARGIAAHRATLVVDELLTDQPGVGGCRLRCHLRDGA